MNKVIHEGADEIQLGPGAAALVIRADSVEVYLPRMGPPDGPAPNYATDITALACAHTDDRVMGWLIDKFILVRGEGNKENHGRERAASEKGGDDE